MAGYDQTDGDAGGGAPSGPAGGDLSGTYPNPTVATPQDVFTAAAGVIAPGGGDAALTDDFVVGSTSLSDIGASGDNRMQFDKGNGAFAAGIQTGTGWDTQAAGSAAFGSNCTPGAPRSLVGGQNSSTSGGAESLVWGDGCDVNNSECLVVGNGNDSTASGGVAHGRDATNSQIYGRAYAGTSFASQGDSQGMELIWRRQTVNATLSEAFLNGASSVATLPTDTTWAFELLAVGRRTDADNESAGYRARGVIDNNAGTTAIVGSVTVDVIAEDQAAWDFQVDANDTNDSLRIRVQGEAAKTINWVITGRIVQVTG